MHNQLLTLMALSAVITACDNRDSDSQTRAFQATPPPQADGLRRKKNDIYPFERTIVDKQGRRLNAIVVGRSHDEIIFQNKDSATPLKRHRYQLSRLSDQDYDFLSALPKHEWQGGGGAIVDSLLDERRRIMERIAGVETEKARTPEAMTRIRALDRELSKLQKTLSETDAAIKIRREKDAQGL
jgi:hypothetical protein